MKPYGLRKHDYQDEMGGPPSRSAKLKSKNRKTSRRLLHKQGRQDGKKKIDGE